ncbi:MAG: hypothetical protein ACK5NN_08115 [Sphingomonadaceae bacterium]
MIFLLILFGSLIALVGFALFIAQRVEYGEARFDSKAGKPDNGKKSRLAGSVVPARRNDDIHAKKREMDDE